ncbi:MAG TPA: FAD-binding protein [Bacillota bacterium]
MPEKLKLVPEKCNGCGLCLQACAFFAVDVVDGKAVFAESCVECGACVPACQPGAIEMAGEGAGAKAGGLWVYVPEGSSPAAVTAVRPVADEQGTTVSAIVTAEPADPSRLFAAGADEVVVLKGPADPAGLLIEAVLKEAPSALYGLAGAETMRVLPRVAAAAGSAYVSLADELMPAYGEKVVDANRPVYSGRFRTRITPSGKTTVFSLDPVAFSAVGRDSARRGQVRTLELPGAKRRDLEPVSREPTRREVPLAQARVVVAGGPGLGSAGNFAKLQSLADRLGGVVGASKEAVDLGWAKPTQLVDSSAGPIYPHLYLAFGIDGSTTHNAAIAKARVVVAVVDKADVGLLSVADFIVAQDPAAVLEAMLRG